MTRFVIALDSPVEALNIGKPRLPGLVAAYPAFDFVFLPSDEKLVDHIADADYVATWHFPADLYPRARHLRAVFTPAAGKDWVAQDPSGRVPVFYGTFHGELIAQSLLGAMLNFNLRIAQHCANKSARDYQRDTLPPAGSLRKQHVLIVGYGNIGRHCARVLRPFHTQVRGTTRKPSRDHDSETGAQYVSFHDLDTVLPWADHVVDLLPGSPETRDVFTRDRFARMKHTAIFYNYGRGTTVDENAICTALADGTIAGAALDVFKQEPLSSDSPLWDAPNLIITPHSSCFFPDYAELFEQELLQHLSNRVLTEG